MSSIHDLYLVQCAKNSPNPLSERLTPQEDAKKENLSGQEFACGSQEPPAALRVNPSLALTFIGADTEPNLSSTDQRIALKNAIEAQQHAKEAIERIRASRLTKRAVIEQLQDKEDFREIDAREKKIIRINTSSCEIEPEFSDTRKLYYNAAKEK